MGNHRLSRQISDSGWGEFVRMLEYKSSWYGSSLVRAPKFYPSSRICSACGAMRRHLDLSEREFVCERCGNIIDRDENAARNLERLATGSSPGSYACGDTSGGGTPLRDSGAVYEPCVYEAGSRH